MYERHANQKNDRIRSAILLVVLCALYLASRLASYSELPIFLDESIHIEFAKKAAAGDYTEGRLWAKWFAIQTLGLSFRFAPPTLSTARLLSILLGLATLAMVFLTARMSASGPSNFRGFLAGLTYLVLPYALFFDRLALADPFHTLQVGLLLYLSAKLLGRQDSAPPDHPESAVSPVSPDEPKGEGQANPALPEEHVIQSATRAPTWMIQFGLAILLISLPLFKFSGSQYAIIPPLLFFLCSRRRGIQMLGPLARPYAIAIPLILIVSFVWPPAPVLSNVFEDQGLASLGSLARQNLHAMTPLFWILFTPGICLLLPLGGALAIRSFRQNNSPRRMLSYVIITAGLIIPYLLVVRIWFPRYFAPLSVPLSLLSGEFLFFVWLLLRERLAKPSQSNILFAGILLIILGPAAWKSYAILTRPHTTSLPLQIREQYFNGWPSGFGLDACIQHLRQESTQGPITVVRSPQWDLPFLGLNAFANQLGSNVKLATIDTWGRKSAPRFVTATLAQKKYVYFVLNSAFPYPGDQEITLAIKERFKILDSWHFPKPGGRKGLLVWKLSAGP